MNSMTSLDERPNPEELMEAIRLEQSIPQKGRLKIFLGMAAGVGKTYAMLEAAQNLKRDGVDVVVGVAETHGREETAVLLKGLEIIPKKEITYKSNVFTELDLDAVIRRKPQLALIDELAHTNVTGSRHLKRWEDVKEILDHGIDVYTTLNVQHIESIKDIVESITNIEIRETVPDIIIDSATYIEIIDLAPDELLQRLKEGKVYLGEQAEIAARNFFVKDRLTALREIILRYAAERVDHDLKGMVSTVTRYESWKPREKLLVGISPSPTSQRLIRVCRRLAYNLDASWIAVYVDTGIFLDEDEQAMLARNLALARNLGADVITTSDPDVAEGIQRIARQKGVTQIVIGRTPGGFLTKLFKRIRLFDRLVSESSDIDIHVIRQTPYATFYRKKFFSFLPFRKQFSAYLVTFLFVLLVSAINYWLLLPFIDYKLTGLIFIFGILAVSLFFRKGPIFFASVLFGLVWDFLFVPPQYTLRIESLDDIAIMCLFFLTAAVTGILVDRERDHKVMLMKRESRTETLYEIVREIATEPSSELLFQSICKRLGQILDGTCEIIIKSIQGGLAFNQSSPIWEDEKEKNAALWSFDNGMEAGWSTTTLPMAKRLFIPLKGLHETVGILTYQPNEVNKLLSVDDKNLLYRVGQQLANNLERGFAEERRRQMDYLNKIEKVHQKIIKLIAEEFKHPLEEIQRCVSYLQQEQSIKDLKDSRQKLCNIETASQNLTRSLNNVTVMARLAGGFGQLNKTKVSIYELVEACHNDSIKAGDRHLIKIDLQEGLPVISCDFNLIKLLLNNLIMNAIQYSPQGSTIEIQARSTDRMVVISVLDEGKGIPPNLMETIFEKFYRVPGVKAPGIGLGLPLAKTIAEMHQGMLKAENRETGGAKFSLYLPIEK